MKITELHLLWYLSGVASLTYIYLLSLGGLELVTRKSTSSKRRGATRESATKSKHSGKQFYGSGNDQSGHKQFLVYVCFKGSYCGGLTDRLMGISAAYVGSVIMKRRFGIISETPCDLSTFYTPNIVHWLISKDDLKNRSSINLVHMSNGGFGKKMKKYMDMYHDIDVIYYKGNSDIIDRLQKNGLINYVPWARNRNIIDIYKIILHRLFKHSLTLVSRFEEFKYRLASDPSNLACAHLRMGRSRTLPVDTNATLALRPDPKAVAAFLRDNFPSKSIKMFIATDSEEIRVTFQNWFPDTFCEVTGMITHIDQANGRENCDGMGKAILDQFILSTCKTLITSNSGFSRMAAIMRGTDENLYLALPNGQVVPSKRTNPSLSFIT